jgi:hypothetical protein
MTSWRSSSTPASSRCRCGAPGSRHARRHARAPSRTARHGAGGAAALLGLPLGGLSAGTRPCVHGSQSAGRSSHGGQSIPGPLPPVPRPPFHGPKACVVIAAALWAAGDAGLRKRLLSLLHQRGRSLDMVR